MGAFEQSRAGQLVWLWQVPGPALGTQDSPEGPGAAVCLISPAQDLRGAAPLQGHFTHTLSMRASTREGRDALDQSDWLDGRSMCFHTWRVEGRGLHFFLDFSFRYSPGFPLKSVGGFFHQHFMQIFKYTAKLKEFYSEQ